MNQIQLDKTLEVWKKYEEKGEKFLNASREYTQEELDLKRREIIPQVQALIHQFLKDEIPLEEFKTILDGINKRNRLWGFQAINGQMFFNVLTKISIAGDRLEEFRTILKKVMIAPSTIEDAKKRIEEFSIFVSSLAKYCVDLRGAPKVGSIPYFLSYFWQIQEPDNYPIYYSSMIHSLRDVDIWNPSGNVSEDYFSFFHLEKEMQEYLTNTTGRNLHLWDVEHAFWFHTQIEITTSPVPESKSLPGEIILEELPESYLPPVVSILPIFAVNDPQINKICQKLGRTIEKEFEERIAILFGMLGFDTELLGQGHGRVPDGVAVSDEYRYAIIYDAKVRQQAYTMGTDERAIREYIVSQGDRLKRRGIKNIYFMIISSGFTGDHDDAIRGMKIDTNVNEVLLVEVAALLAMLEGMLRNPAINLGPEGIQRLLAFSGILTESAVREFLEI